MMFLFTTARLPPVLLFTDGAVEEEAGEVVATIGAVLFDPLASERPEFLAERVHRAPTRAPESPMW